MLAWTEAKKPAATVNCEIVLQEHRVFAQLIS